MARRPMEVNPLGDVIPGQSAGLNPESRDSPRRNGASEVRCFASPRNDGTKSPLRRRNAGGAGAEFVGAEVGQLAFQAFEVEPQRPAMAEQQQRAAAGGFPRVEFDP